MDAVILIDKPAGITSNNLVQKVKKHLKANFNKDIKVGHTGTLDYFATGLMILTIEKAVRLTQYFQGLDKEYIATGELGKITDTYDINGKVLEERECNVSEEDLKVVIKSFEKTYFQYPPAYSAKRVDGKRAYQLAKKGIHPELNPKEVTVYSIEILKIQFPFFTIKVHCSSGTYIRSLIKEIGDETGCGAYTKELRRTKIDGFSVEEAISLDDFLNLNKEEIEKIVIPIEKSLRFLPKIVLSEGFDFRFVNGQRFKVNFEREKMVQVFSQAGKLLGIGFVDENGILHPKTVFR
jgi:tRNA pseudouridine55 synthase